jgi:glycosyltransferase involved in cell wall biosynthesis/SAM-dependent methyltransferase
MRVAFFSPMPPSKSGIADYSAAVLEALRPLVDVTVFDEGAGAFDPAQFDIAVYQLGNNPHHAGAYQAALKHPGVVVMHEANLHHLIVYLTIKQGDWDAYLREAEYNGGAEALAFAHRVRALETGPDYEGLPMMRRVLERARGIIVHSRFMVEQVRAAGFKGPVARIPHGAWIPEADRCGYRGRLGLDATTPLVGVFGFLKPYKRIAESLHAFRRLLRVEPRAKMILAGEPHPELRLEEMIRALGLSSSVRILGFTPEADFVGLVAASDIVLNLRYPTVGESSGTLLRALGLAKPVLVSDVGSFRELPDDICLKVPVDAAEEDQIYEYLNLLVSRPEVARTIGERARRWVKRECTWDLVARRYARFLECLANGEEWVDEEPLAAAAAAAAGATPAPAPVSPEEIRKWAPPDPLFRHYVDTHMARLKKTLEITPPGGPLDRVLEMGAYLQITPALKSRLGYGEVRGCYYGKLGQVDHRVITSADGERFECDLDLFDAECDRFPYPDAHFATVLCCELIEHLSEDPMHMMAEINRILRTGGHVVLTTPNIVSLYSISAMMQGYHPGTFPHYLRPDSKAGGDARHSREYTPAEIWRLLSNAGFEVALLDTGPFREEPKPELDWVRRILARYKLSVDLRGSDIFAVGRKTGPVRERYPAWLYSTGGHE